MTSSESHVDDVPDPRIVRAVVSRLGHDSPVRAEVEKLLTSKCAAVAEKASALAAEKYLDELNAKQVGAAFTVAVEMAEKAEKAAKTQHRKRQKETDTVTAPETSENENAGGNG